MSVCLSVCLTDGLSVRPSVGRPSVRLYVTVCLNAFAQFSRYRVETLQVGRGQPGTGHGWFEIVRVLLLELVGTGRGGVKIVGVLLRVRGGEGGGGEVSKLVTQDLHMRQYVAYAK